MWEIPILSLLWNHLQRLLRTELALSLTEAHSMGRVGKYQPLVSIMGRLVVPLWPPISFLSSWLPPAVSGQETLNCQPSRTPFYWMRPGASGWDQEDHQSFHPWTSPYHLLLVTLQNVLFSFLAVTLNEHVPLCCKQSFTGKAGERKILAISIALVCVVNLRRAQCLLANETRSLQS